MWDLLKENWISVSALIVALLGGIPGIISVVSYYHNRPIFGFKTEGILTGTLASGSFSGKNTLMLFGTVTNAGAKPLNPSRFDLKIIVRDEWISLQRAAIPQNSVFNGEKLEIKIEDAAKVDLQGWSRPITIEEPARGILMFISNELDIKSLRSSNQITFQLTCIDIFSKKYTVTTTYGPFVDIDTQQKILKHGITIRPKD